jgi:hypothetical protein
MFKNLFKRKRKTETSSLVDFETITLWTAGIKFETRINSLMGCKIHEKVILERQPNNEIDTNAIHIKRKNGQSLGFIGKAKAQLLSTLLDNQNAEPIATIINLKCDSRKENYGVKLSIKIKPECMNIFVNSIDDIDYTFELSSSNNLYLLIDCDEKTLTKVKKLLYGNDIEIQYSGVSYSKSSNGKNYDWYIKLNNDEDKKIIQRVLVDSFPALRIKSDKEFKYKYLEIQDEELDSLKNSNEILTQENERINNKLNRIYRKVSQTETQFDKFCGLFLPNTDFIHDSHKILISEEIGDFSKAFLTLQKIETDLDYKGKPMKTLDKWYDTHFNTGIKDDGRIYFKRENKKTTILVSLKKNQTSDIKLLKKYK